jgi:hypothetical protein
MNMKNLTICLTLAVLLGTTGASWSADYQKGLAAYNRDDFATALREWKPLAEQGDARAQSNLGVMYGLGRGVLQDYVYAHMWGNIAASNGYEDGGKLRDAAAKEMTAAQIEKAEELASECVRKEYKGC